MSTELKIASMNEKLNEHIRQYKMLKIRHDISLKNQLQLHTFIKSTILNNEEIIAKLLMDNSISDSVKMEIIKLRVPDPFKEVLDSKT